MYGGLYLAHSRGGTLARALLFTDPSDLQARYAVASCLDVSSTITIMCCITVGNLLGVCGKFCEWVLRTAAIVP